MGNFWVHTLTPPSPPMRTICGVHLTVNLSQVSHLGHN